MLKAIAKKVVGNDRWGFLSWHRSRFGFLPAIRAYIDLLRNKGIGRAPNELTGGSVFLRPGTVDIYVCYHMLISKDYDINLRYSLFILDAGAHIGLSSVFFASKYPKQRSLPSSLSRPISVSCS